MADYIKMDENGRLVVPKKIREYIKSNKFIMKIENKRIILEPIKGVDELYGAMR